MHGLNNYSCVIFFFKVKKRNIKHGDSLSIVLKSTQGIQSKEKEEKNNKEKKKRELEKEQEQRRDIQSNYY